MRRLVATFLVICILLVIPVAGAQSATPGDKGVSISPLRQLITADAGTPKNSSVTVGNLSSSPLPVTISIQKFDVADYTYDYRFSAPQPNWLSLSTSQVTLQPHEQKTITYIIDAPADAAPGGTYYTLLASAQTSNKGVKSTIQAASLLYVTINGKLITTNQLKNSTIQHLSFGHDFSYSLDMLDTGNVHYFVYTVGQLQGVFTGPPPSKVAHLLMPGAIRRISDTIPSPKLPGLYKATYGYSTDDGQSVTRTSYVVFIPPWSIAFTLLVLLGVYSYYSHRRKAKKPDEATRS